MKLIRIATSLTLYANIPGEVITILKQFGAALLASDSIRLFTESPDVVGCAQILCLFKIHSLYIYLWQIYV
jgi:hypothetical protein